MKKQDENQLEELKKAEKEWTKQIKVIKEILYEVQQKIKEIETGIKRGDIVEYNGKKYKIKYYDFDWPVGIYIKQDGKLSKKEVGLYRDCEIKVITRGE